MFSVVDAVLLDPFPYRDADRLVLIWGSKAKDTTPGISGADLEDWRAGSRTFDDIDAYLGNLAFSLGDDGPGVPAGCIGSRVLPLLGVPPVLGRNFTAGEARFGGEPVVILSDDLWRTRFAADPAIVGRRIRLDEQPYSIIGVMPPGFFFPDTDARLWVPAPCGHRAFHDRGSRTLHAVARLGPGVRLADAQADLDAINARLAEAFPDTNRNRTAGLFPLREIAVGGYERALWTLLAAVTAVLLIACANVVHLHLARGVERQTEMAIRAAAGATRWRLARQLLTETTVLVAAAMVVAVALAAFGLQALQALSLTDIPRLDRAGIDRRVLGFTAAAALCAAFASGVWPAWRLSAVNLTEPLKLGGSASPTRHANKARDLLAISEIAAAVILLVLTALVVRSFVQLSRTDWGFTPERLVVFDVRLPRALWRNAPAEREVSAAIKRQLEALSSVEHASVGYAAPIRWQSWSPTLLLVNGTARDGFGVWTVGEGYFATAGIRLLEGREFGAQDHERAARRVVVSREAARRLWPGQPAVGRSLSLLGVPRTGRKPDPSVRERLRRGDAGGLEVIDGIVWEVIGVADDVRMFGFDIAPQAAVYMDARQRPAAVGLPQTSLKVLLRTSDDPGPAIEPARTAIASIVPDSTFTEIALMSELVAQSIGGRGTSRLMVLVAVAFGGMALFFTTIGCYGIVSHGVALRLREIGIRMALGAGRRDIAALVLGQATRLLLAGLALGITGAWAVTRGMSTLLVGVTPTDAAAYAAGILLLTAAVLLACVPPLRRARRVDPVSLLRA